MDSSVNQEDGSFISFDYNLQIQSGKKKQKPWEDYHALEKSLIFFFKLLEIIQTNKIEPGQFSTKAKFYVYSIWNQPKIASNYIFPLGHIYMTVYTLKWNTASTVCKAVGLCTGMCPFYSCECLDKGLKS